MRSVGSSAPSSVQAPGPAVEAIRAAPRRRFPVLNLALFAITLVTTTIAGALNANVPPSRLAAGWTAGLPFSLSLMGILLSHEMGHYVLAKIHRVPATLPFFLPGPPVLIGTFGAFIRMRASPRDRRALFDVGAAGPWAGFVVALPVTIVGLRLSEAEAIPPDLSGFYFGDSLLFRALSAWILGPIPYGFDVVLHPVAMAGWFGLFVTALNLLPVGQLDGGHVIYSMFGGRHRVIARTFLLTILALGFLGWPGWFVWAVLVTFAGVDHPPTLDRHTRLDPMRTLLAWVTLALFLATLVPVPITPFEGGVGLPSTEVVPVDYTPGP